MLNTTSMEGFNYTLTYTHIASNRSWTYGLKEKSGKEVLTSMKDLVETQLPKYGIQMAQYHADGAGELIGKHIRDY